MRLFKQTVAHALLRAVSALLPALVFAQTIPHKDKPPVVFLNGYQNDCSGSSFASTFGVADQLLSGNGQVTVFFDNCTVAGKPSIEELGTAFGRFLAGLKYDDGQPVTTVDAVTHSMGGLILRSYLSGKQSGSATFQPPAATGIRRAVFLATPHFGTPVASSLGGSGPRYSGSTTSERQSVFVRLSYLESGD